MTVCPPLLARAMALPLEGAEVKIREARGATSRGPKGNPPAQSAGGKPYFFTLLPSPSTRRALRTLPKRRPAKKKDTIAKAKVPFSPGRRAAR